MPTKQDRKALNEAMNNKNQDQIRMLLQRDDAKELLLMEDHDGWLPVHYACSFQVDKACLQLILNAAGEHGMIKKMVEEKDNDGSTCLHYACHTNLSVDSLRLLLEYLLKHADSKKMLEEKDNNGASCLHFACYNKLSADSLRLLLEYLSKHADIKMMLEEETFDGWTALHSACAMDLSTNSLRLLISFFPSNILLATALGSKTIRNNTPLDLARNDEHKQLLRDPDCWRKCRYWLFCNYQDTFLNSLYPNSPEKTLEALKELNKSYAGDETVAKAIADFQRLKPLSEEELDRQELEKLIFDRSSRDRFIEQVIPLLVQNEVTKESFFLLNENHLKEMGVKIGPRVQLLQIIEQETFRRSNLSARSDISSRPRSPGRTPRIVGGVPPIALSASNLIQQHQQFGNAPPLPVTSKESNSEEQQRSFVATENSGTETVNGGSESYNSGPTAKS